MPQNEGKLPFQSIMFTLDHLKALHFAVQIQNRKFFQILTGEPDGFHIFTS